MTSLRLQDNLDLSGDLRLSKFQDLDKPGEIIYEDLNKIMRRSLAQILTLVYDTSGTAAPDPITQLRVGTGGVYPGSQVLRPVPNNRSSLYTPVALTQYTPGAVFHNRSEINVNNLTSSSPTDVTFTMMLDPGDLVDVVINEAALYTQSGKMFNMRTFPSIRKTNEFYLRFDWTLRYKG